MPKFVAWPVGTLATMFLLYFAKPVLVPLLLAVLLAQLLVPVVERLERFLPRALAVLLSLCLVGVVLTGIVAVVNDQVATFQKTAPDLQERMKALLASWQQFASAHFGVQPQHPMELVTKALEGLVGAGGHVAALAFGVTMGIVSTAFLVTIFSFLMLYYRAHFRRNIVATLARHGGGDGPAVMERILEVGQKYVAGLLTVIGIIGALDTVGFLLVRSPFPVLFGLLGALAVLIPYVGIFLVAPACALLAFVATGSPLAAGGVLAVYAVVHFLEGNVITPYLVGHQVNLNPLTSLLAVLIGGELWGPAGMLLFLPLAGMVELTLESIPGAEPVARLLGSVPAEKPPGRRRRLWPALRAVFHR